MSRTVRFSSGMKSCSDHSHRVETTFQSTPSCSHLQYIGHQGALPHGENHFNPGVDLGGVELHSRMCRLFHGSEAQLELLSAASVWAPPESSE